MNETFINLLLYRVGDSFSNRIIIMIFLIELIYFMEDLFHFFKSL